MQATQLANKDRQSKEIRCTKPTCTLLSDSNRFEIQQVPRNEEEIATFLSNDCRRRTQVSFCLHRSPRPIHGSSQRPNTLINARARLNSAGAPSRGCRTHARPPSTAVCRRARPTAGPTARPWSRPASSRARATRRPSPTAPSRGR